MINNIKIFGLLTLALVLNSCGSGSIGGGRATWGIDHKPSKTLPTCDGDVATTTNAINAVDGSQIIKMADNTYIRIYHYQDGTKKVCTIQGEALIYEKDK